MEQLKKQLEDIKGALPLMVKLGSIYQSAYKTLNEALSEALQQYDFIQRGKQFSCPLHETKDCDRHRIDDEEGCWEFCNTCKYII